MIAAMLDQYGPSGYEESICLVSFFIRSHCHSLFLQEWLLIRVAFNISMLSGDEYAASFCCAIHDVVVSPG